MSAQHTPGLMTWKRRPDGSLYYVIGDHKTGPHAQGDIYINEADLKRLAACWNACEGVPTELLEAYPAPFSQLRAQCDDMLAALIVAREFISTDRTALADCAMDPEGCMSEDDAAAVADYDKALLQIDAAIQKATGGAA